VLALKKVERSLMTVPSRGTRVLPPPDLGTFLKTYMLGLISVINDMLQDVQGKKTVTVKRQILRSLGALVIQIGPSISNVSPQVGSAFLIRTVHAELHDIS
jgi:serine/threonine-protein kinase ATR